MSNKSNLLNFTFPQLKKWVEEVLNEPSYRTTQIWQWIWQKMAKDFDSMTNISKQLRTKLNENAQILWPKITTIQKSEDNTTKFLLELEDGKMIETVLIPSENRNGDIRWAQCISTQAGCPMGCTFCATGKMGFKRNLTMAEILGQVLIGRDYLGDIRLDKPILRNLVFMGMGEPLLNTKALIPALEVLSSDHGMNFSPRRMTVSTSGVEAGLKELGQSGLAYLAISLHAPDQALRERIMPKAAAWPLEQMFKSLKTYPIKTRERITFEYLLLGGVNDSIEHAKKLAFWASQIKAKINIINYNSVPGIPYKPSDPVIAQAFQDYLCAHNITAIMRKSKGADIAAACGQLQTQYAHDNN